MRLMTRDDVDQVLRIEQEVQTYPWTRGNFIDALNANNWCHVDETAGKIRGYLILMPVLEEVELLNIGVALAEQRKGLGHAMLQEMLEAVRQQNMHRMFLEVRKSNVAAIALYRNIGFAEIGFRRGYYRNANSNEDALLMARDITGEKNGQT